MTPKRQSPPLTRLFAVLAIVITMPFSGMALAAQAKVCDSQSVASTAALQNAGCCGERHQPCGTQGQSCLGAGSGCVQGGGQVQAIDRVCMPFTAIESSRQNVVASVTTLMSATGPDGQWRPPRSL